jgi:hypothetical protein
VAYCVIGGLAVNAYVEPVVSLDLDIVVIVDAIEKFIQSIRGKFKIEKSEHSINLESNDSDIRIQLQTDEHFGILSRPELKSKLPKSLAEKIDKIE